MAPSIAHQTEDDLGGPDSVLARQRRDHIELDRLLERCRRSGGVEQQQVLRKINRLVFPHAFAEEAVLWPAVRRHVPEGEALTRRVEQQHQEVNQLVTDLEATDVDDERRPDLLDRIAATLRNDVRDEEDELLPRLQAVVEVDELRRLGRSWELVRRIAPTRPHPVVSRRPPGNVVSAVPLSALDRSRDLADRVALARPGRVGDVSSAASQRLSRVAGAVERLGPLRRGEHPSTALDEDAPEATGGRSKPS